MRDLGRSRVRQRSICLWFGVLFAAGVGTGCSGPVEGTTESVGTLAEAITVNTAASFWVKLPKQIAVTDSVVTASGTVTLGDRTTVLSSTGKGAVSTTGSARLTVGLDAKPRKVVANAAATIGDRTKVDGDLLIAGSPTIGTQVQVFGTTQLNANVDEQPIFKVPVLVPDVVAGNVSIEPDRQVTLTPAKYGNVSIKSRSSVTLSTGIYEFNSLDVLEPQAKLIIDDAAGPVIIYVKSSFIYRGGVQNKAVSGRFPKLLMVYLGTSDLWIESPFQGHLFAPNATSHLRPGQGQFIGSFWGKNVDSNPDTVLVHKPFTFGAFFPTDPKLGPNDGPVIIPQSDPTRYDNEDPLLGTPIKDPQPLPTGKPGAVNCVSNLIAVPSAQADKAQKFRYMSAAERAAAGCVDEYKECTIGADGRVVGSPTVPSETQLNTVPPASSKCAASQPQVITYNNADGTVTSTKVCGVSNAVLSLPEAQRKVCTTDAQCSATEMCAKFCPSGQSCSNENDYKRYCAAKRTTCTELPEQTTCVERNVCPFDGYTGNDYVAPPTGKEDLPPEKKVLQSTTPTLPGYRKASCSETAPLAIGSADETTPPQNSGNDQWGISFKPIVNYGFKTPQSPLGMTEELGANGQASFNIDAKVWGMNVPILHLGVDGTIGPDEMALVRTSQLFGQDVDLTGEVNLDSLPKTISTALSNVVRPQMANVEAAFAKAQIAQSQLLTVRDFLASHDLSDVTTEAGKKSANELCMLAVDILGAKMGYKTRFLCNTSPTCQTQRSCDDSLSGNCLCPASEVKETADEVTARLQKAVTDSIAVWQKNLTDELNKFGGDPQQALANAIASIKNQMPGTNANLKPEIPLKAGRHRFAALSFAFTFPVGPVPVTMEIELAGSWGLQAKLELQGQFDPRSTQDMFARAGASVIPGMDIQALAFAGVNVGFAQVGIGGELTLIDLEIPIRGGGEVRGERIPDTRPLSLDLGNGTAQDISDLANSVERLLNTRWNAGFYYGAGMHAEILSGNINLQARIRLLFFSTSFKKILAKWSGIPFDVSFVGSIKPVQGLTLPDEVRGVVDNLEAAGKKAQDLKALVPLAQKGFTGYFGGKLPLLKQSALSSIWPPAYNPSAPVTNVPSTQSFCGTRPPVVF